MVSKITLPPKTEFKTFDFQLKTVDEDQGLVTGYLSTFGNIDEQNDRVVLGAFRKTIQDAKTRKDNGRKYLWPMLWMHNPDEPIGGYIDAQEDDKGLLVTAQLDISTNAQGFPNNPTATKVFSGYKSGYIDEQSIGYNPIQKEYQNGIRNLKEIRIVEGSAVTMLFAANPQALVPATGVKSNTGDIEDMEVKDVCGNTSGPIGPRDEAWDGSKAQKQIWAAAESEDGSISASVAKKYFMNVEGDGTKKGDYSYPFWYVGDDPHICVGAVKAIAAAIQGARNANPPDGLKSKVETLYNRINAKYPDDPQLTPPWKDDEKSNGNKPMNRKTFEENYADAMCQDLLEDWNDVLLCAFTQSILDACKIGDMIENDVQTALEAFNKQVLMWAAQAQQYGLSQYLTDNSYSPADYTMQNGSSSNSYGYMSRRDRPSGKSGARFSEDTKSALSEHVKSVMDVSKKMQNMSDELAAHAGSLQQKASDLTQLYQSEGQGPAFAEDNDDNTGKSNAQRYQSEKRREPFKPTLTREKQPPKSTEFTLDDLDAIARELVNI